MKREVPDKFIEFLIILNIILGVLFVFLLFAFFFSGEQSITGEVVFDSGSAASGFLVPVLIVGVMAVLIWMVYRKGEI
jgi:heme/copper-type cytochrome/quinol oxidase subunit 2